jgi:hypothetical protein
LTAVMMIARLCHGCESLKKLEFRIRGVIVFGLSPHEYTSRHLPSKLRDNTLIHVMKTYKAGTSCTILIIVLFIVFFRFTQDPLPTSMSLSLEHTL